MSRILKFAAAPILVLLLAGLANAQLYSPAFCSPIVTGARFTDVATAILGGRFFNVSGVPIDVVCPAVKNRFRPFLAHIDVSSPSNTNITCRLFSLDERGNSVSGSPVTASGFFRIFFDTSGLGESTLGSYSIECTLPPFNGAILSYAVFD
jgi:hypothetical protein